MFQSSVKAHKKNFHYLMMVAALMDLLYILCATVLFAVPHIWPGYTYCYNKRWSCTFI